MSGDASLWDATSCARLHNLTIPDTYKSYDEIDASATHHVAICDNASTAVSTLGRYHIMCWNVRTGACIRALKMHPKMHLIGVNLSANGDVLVAGAHSRERPRNELRMWNVKSGRSLQTLTFNTEGSAFERRSRLLRCMDMSSDANRLITGHDGGRVVVWDVPRNE